MTTQGRILIVDDEPGVRSSLSRWFRDDGYEVGMADGASEALTRLSDAKWDLALVDIRMPGTDGIELQRRMHQVDPDLVVIMMTGYASVDTAVAALKNGAYDYITKPLDPDDVSHLVRNALAHRRTQEENVRLRDVVTAQAITDIIGQSAAMKKVITAIETVAATDATVLITGESGTGKEVVARAIHNASPRRFHPMVAIHCGALTETLLESELFGHEKGAFTGAQYRKKGKFEMSEGGTAFLDEIGDISLKTQTDLLRVLQEKEITRVGGHQPMKVDFRCIAATNKDLDVMIKDGRFRPDLYYRLNVFRIELPPLRDRREDIPALAAHFLKRYAEEYRVELPGFSQDALDALASYNWPGNIRELENEIQRLVIQAESGHWIEVTDLSPRLRKIEGTVTRIAPKQGTLKEMMDQVERWLIAEALREHNNNKTRTAAALGITREGLHKKLAKFGV